MKSDIEDSPKQNSWPPLSVCEVEAANMPGQLILIVDDESKIVEVIRSYLEKAGFPVISAGSGYEALTLFERHQPGLIILDLMLPGLSGEDVIRTVRRRSNVPVIMLTAKSEEEQILKGLELGADDYVTKPFSPRQLVARVCAVLRRSGVESPAPADVWSFNTGDLIIDEPHHEVRRAGQDIALTPNEFKILVSMARHPSKAFTREELIAFAIGDEYAGMDRVIDTHIKNLRQKIEMDPKSPVYILTIYGIGYKFGGKLDENQS